MNKETIERGIFKALAVKAGWNARVASGKPSAASWRLLGYEVASTPYKTTIVAQNGLSVTMYELYDKGGLLEFSYYWGEDQQGHAAVSGNWSSKKGQQVLDFFEYGVMP